MIKIYNIEQLVSKIRGEMAMIQVREENLLNSYLEKGRIATEEFKIIALKLIIEFKNIKKVADILRMPASTLYKWLRSWNEGKLEGIKNRQGLGGGRQSKLSKEQKEELKKVLEACEILTTDIVCEIILEKFGILYSKRQINRILRGLGANLMKPYIRDIRRPKDAEVQLLNELKKTFDLLKEKGIAKKDIALGFLDQSSPQLSSNTVRLWSFKKKFSYLKILKKSNSMLQGFTP